MGEANRSDHLKLYQNGIYLALYNILKFKYLPNVILKMRIGGASSMSFKNIIIKSLEDYRIIKKNNIGSPISVLFQKNISKIPQFFKYKIKKKDI